MNTSSLFACSLLFLSAFAYSADQLKVELEIPDINASPYYRPYVAVWLEDAQRQPITTLAIWYQIEMPQNAQEDGKKWLKDLRQWWRKTGRSQQPNYDGVTGATRKPGRYTLTLDREQLGDLDLSGGEYVVHFEAAREEGGRSYHRVPIAFSPEQKTITIPAKNEFGKIVLQVLSKS